MQDNVAPEDDAERQAGRKPRLDPQGLTSGMISAILVIGLPAMTGLSILHSHVAAQSLATARANGSSAVLCILLCQCLESPAATATMDVGGYRCGLRLFSIPTFFPQWFIAQGLKPDVYYEAAAVTLPDPAGTTLENRARDKPGSDLQTDGLQAKTARDSQWSRDGCSH